MNVSNRMNAWLFVVDRYRAVRWKACGEATPSEIESLKRVIDNLYNEN